MDWENRSIDQPQPDAPYYRAFFLPSEPVQMEITGTAKLRYNGIFQVSIYYPKNLGDGLAQTDADTILAAFTKGSTVTWTDPDTHVTTSVRILRSWRSAGSETPEFYHVPVSIRWRCDL